MRENAGLYRHRLKMAETARSVLATPWRDRRILNPATQRQGVTARIIARHLMPDCLAIYLILAAYDVGFSVIVEASLSFLRVGVPPHVPGWGGMPTAAARGHVTRAP